MKRRVFLALTMVIAAFAMFTATANACLMFGYQPEVPKSLR